MSVTAINAFSGPFAPNGSTTAFPFTFVAASAAEVQVIRLSAAEVVTVLGGYTVALNTNGTGTVTFSSAPAAGDPIYILSAPSFQQQVTFVNQGSFSPTSLNLGLDQAATRAIYLKSVTDRAIVVPLGETGSTLPSAAARANKVPAFDVSGNLYTPNVAASDLEILAGIASAVATVAADHTSVVAVAGDVANINIVAGSIANVNAVGPSIGNVNICATNIAAIIAAPGYAAAALASQTAAAASASSLGGLVEGVSTATGATNAQGGILDMLDSDGRSLLEVRANGMVEQSSGVVAAFSDGLAVDNTASALSRLDRHGRAIVFTDWWGVMVAGQSNAVGNGGVLTTASQGFGNKKVSGGALVDLVEVTNETVASGLASQASNMLARTKPPWATFPQTWIVNNMGSGGAAYTALKKGTGPYNGGIAAVTTAHGLAVAAGKTYAERALIVLHGEQDSVNALSNAAYLADLIEWKNDWNTDVLAITGQTDRIPMFIIQMGYQADNSIIGHTGPVTAMFDAMLADNEIYVIAPGYLGRLINDGLHYTADDERMFGCMLGKALHRYYVQGLNPATVYPTAVALIDSRTVDLTFRVPVPPLQFDLEYVWPISQNLGFAIYDAGGAEVALADCPRLIPQENKVRLVASATVASGYSVTYGLKLGAHQVTGGQGAGRRKGARGCLRDSDRALSYYSDSVLGTPYPNQNYCPAFSKVIP